MLVIILHEPLLIYYQIRALVVLDEDLDVCLTVNHVCCLREILTPVMHGFAHRVNDLGEFHQVVLHEANLLVVILLHFVQRCPVPCANLVHLQIDLLDLF